MQKGFESLQMKESEESNRMKNEAMIERAIFRRLNQNRNRGVLWKMR